MKRHDDASPLKHILGAFSTEEQKVNFRAEDIIESDSSSSDDSDDYENASRPIRSYVNLVRIPLLQEEH